jgi:DNA polymerase III epsilon subunit-like protein
MGARELRAGRYRSVAEEETREGCQMIVIDNETTHLTVPEAAPIEQQPSVTEFAAIRLDDKTLKEVNRMQFLCDPRVPIPPESIAITGITNEMVKGRPPFSAFFPALVDYFLGERTVAAHNLSFDIAVLRHEINRLGRVTAFPWPPVQICTVERTINLKGHRLNLGDLHLLLTGKEHKDAHRAMADVEALCRVIRALRKKGLL